MHDYPDLPHHDEPNGAFQIMPARVAGWLIAFIALVVLAIWLCTQAQASVFGYQWVKAHEPISNVVYVVASQDEVARVCGVKETAVPGYTPGRNIGCVVRDYKAAPPVCYIVGPWSKEDAPEWYKAHEQGRHCEKGEDHP
jgi:hypothetical protein